MSKYKITNITNFNDPTTVSEREITFEKKDIRYIQTLYKSSRQTGLLQDLLIRRLQDEASDIVSSSRSISDIGYFTSHIMKADYSSEDGEQKLIQLFTYLLIVYYYIPITDYISSTVVRQTILDAILMLSIQRECNIMREFVYFALCSRRQLRDGTQELLASKIPKYSKFIKSQIKEMLILTEELNTTVTLEESMDISAAMELGLDLENQFCNMLDI